ncbi:MAG: hypothetical protein JNM58_17535 [Xanthomonadaceae bacterium]|nr:hypothetical protein [Xanthomonadaceae bacterium]
MVVQGFRFAFASVFLLLATLFTSSAAYAQMSGGGDAPKAASGLGQARPDAIDLTTDPAWQVYEFERDGIRYLQVNDTADTTRVAIGQIGATAWVLPIGRDADRVSIQTDTQLPAASHVVYRDNEVEVVVYRQSDQDRWIVRPRASSSY